MTLLLTASKLYGPPSSPAPIEASLQGFSSQGKIQDERREGEDVVGGRRGEGESLLPGDRSPTAEAFVAGTLQRGPARWPLT